jgi:glycosyltransferase involved in cell wall biosynthesis
VNNRRILYILHPFDFPAGGVAVIYEHVELLAASGFNAYVALPEKPPVDFYQSRAPLMIHHGKLELQPGDIYVIPEGFGEYMEVLKDAPARKLMFCQSLSFLPFSANPHLGFREYHVDGVIVSSEAIRSFFSEVYRMPDVPLIPCAIDPHKFPIGRAKVRQIAYMPRKLPQEAQFIQATFRRIYPEYADIPWVAIENRTRQEAADILGASEVFMYLSYLESFGLPPLEAMACGCLVAGYHGNGGREYMTERNGWWAEGGDWRACVDGLACAFRLLDAGGEPLEAMRREMAATVGRYSPERMKQALLAFWEAEVNAP